MREKNGFLASFILNPRRFLFYLSPHSPRGFKNNMYNQKNTLRCVYKNGRNITEKAFPSESFINFVLMISFFKNHFFRQ